MDQRDARRHDSVDAFFSDKVSVIVVVVILLLLLIAWRIHKVDTDYQIDPKTYVKTSIEEAIQETMRRSEEELSRKILETMAGMEERLQKSVAERAEVVNKRVGDQLGDQFKPLEADIKKQVDERMEKLEGKLAELLEEMMEPMEKDVRDNLERMNADVAKRLEGIGDAAKAGGASSGAVPDGCDGCARLKAIEERLGVLERQHERILALLGDASPRSDAGGAVVSPKKSKSSDKPKPAPAKPAAAPAPTPASPPPAEVKNALFNSRMCLGKNNAVHVLRNQIMITLRDISYPMRSADFDLTMPNAGVHRFWYIQEGSRRAFEYDKTTYLLEVMKVSDTCVDIAINQRLQEDNRFRDSVGGDGSARPPGSGRITISSR